MSRMKAVVVDQKSPGRLAIREVDRRDPLPYEAVVRVAAVSLNLGEVRRAQMEEDGAPIGWDLSGIVEQAASDGSGPPEGTRVVGFLPTGAWAEYAVVPTNALAALPENVSFAQAATLPVAGLTALYIMEKGRGLLTRNVLVTGANGGVGLFACRIAKLYGAHVVGLVRREKYVEMVKSAGADDVVVSEDGAAAADFGPYRLIAESVGGRVLGNCLKMLSPDGICVTFGVSASTETTFQIYTLMRAERASLYGFLLFNELEIEPASEGLARLIQLVSDGRLEPHVTVEEPWTKIGQVVSDFWNRKIPGKAVLHIQ